MNKEIMVIEFLLDEVKERLEAIKEYEDNKLKHEIHCKEWNLVNSFENRGAWRDSLIKFKIDGPEPTRSIITGNLKMIRRLTMAIQRGE